MTTESKNFIVYKASAGSGKTYTLVKEYLKLVLVNPQKYRHILAVTFTNKAAYEMKSRVITYLQALSELNDSTIPEAVKKKNKEKYAELIQELSFYSGMDETHLSDRATVVLQKILHNYSDFAISTIDSFVQKIIRTFAYDLKLSQNFEVELDSERVLSQAVDVILSYAGVDEEITKILIEFIKQKMDDGKSWEIETDLKEFAGQLLKEDTQKYIGLFENISLADFGRAKAGAFAQRAFLSKEAVKCAENILKIINEQNIDIKSFYYGNSGMPGFFQKVMVKNLGDVATNSYCIKAIEEDVWYGKGTAETQKQKIDAIKDRIAAAYTAITAMIVEYLNLTLMIKSLYPLSLLSLIEKESEAIKADENIIFISDFYRKIHEQLLNEPVPFIYQRAGEKFEHFFIDEFQDTSVMQFQNMLPLIENSLASGNTNLIVGDGKQAIYRWRNGEVMQFAALPLVFDKPALPHFDDIETSLERNFIYYNDYDKTAKNINFRSQKELVEFNNGLFDFLSAELLDEKTRTIFHDLRQQVKARNDGGYVNIHFFENDENYEDSQLNNILHLIAGLTEKGVPRKDIAVICRTNITAANVAVSCLTNGVDVVSSESLLLNSSAAVNFLVSVFSHINKPDDDLPVAFIIYYLQKNFSSGHSLNQLFMKYRNKLSRHASELVEELIKLFAIDVSFRKLSLLPLYDLTEELIRIFGFNKKADPFVVYFLDAVNEFIQNNTPAIPEFLDWWNKKGSSKSIVVPDKLNAVKIMTIHKAKGLEFPVVIYPFADESDVSKNATAWIEYTHQAVPGIAAFPVNITKSGIEGSSFQHYLDEEKSKAALDMLNICYVALTRPENRLYILSKKYGEKESRRFGFMLKKYFKHIGVWADEKDEYEFGVDAAPEKSEAKDENSSTVIPSALISARWPDKMLIRYNSSIVWSDDEAGNSISWGNIIHRVLSEIRTADDVAAVLTKMEREGVVNPNEKEKIRQYLDECLTDPDIGAFFEKGLKILTEAEILTPENKLYRPDRIIFGEQKNIVIDFKTGAEKEEHKTQICNYADLVSEISGKPAEKYLVYLHEKVKIVKI